MAKTLSKTARDALAATDWGKIDAMTDSDIARQIAANPDAAPDMAPPIDVRAIRCAAGMTQAQFAAAYEFSIRARRQKAQRPRPDSAARHQSRSRRLAQSACRGVARLGPLDHLGRRQRLV
jgi:putative transcriptional regulator